MMQSLRMRLAHLSLASVLSFSLIGAVDAACTEQTVTTERDSITIGSGDNVCVTNSGEIPAAGRSPAVGVAISGPSVGEPATVVFTNTSAGQIGAVGGAAQGVSVQSGIGLDATIINQGFIDVQSLDAAGEPAGISAIDSAMNGDPVVIQNKGTIEVTVAGSGSGIFFNNTVARVVNDGLIVVTTSQYASSNELYGIEASSFDTLTANSLITNNGRITVFSQSTLNPVIEIVGIKSSGGSIANAGVISVQSSSVRSITGIALLDGNGGSVSNSGAINVQITGNQVQNSVATGMAVMTAPTGSISVVNSGTIIATTVPANDYTDQAIGVSLTGENITFTNSGTIKAEGSRARAIEVTSTNTVVELTETSVVIGDIYTNQQGNILRHSVGAAQHYVLQTTGDWVLEDMDGRPVVKGSAMAAGVGWAETADEMLFERTQLFLQSMDRGQMRRDRAGDSALWVDPYAYDSKRSASSSDPTVVKYGSNGFGLTLGYDFRAFGVKAQAIGNIQSGRLNIEDNTQDVDSTSWLVGLRLPSFYELGSVSFSAMAFAGRNQYSSDSRVLTNTTSTGTDIYSSSFDSTQLLFGLGASYTTPIAPTTDLSFKADLYLSQEYLEGYQEGPYFYWNSRTLTQGSAFLEAGIDHHLNDEWRVQAKVGANAQTLFSGGTTRYSINNTPVSFSGGQSSDTGLYAMLGTQYQVKDNTRVGLSVWYGQTTNSVQTIQGMIEAKFLF